MTDDDPEDFCSAETVILTAEQMAEILARTERAAQMVTERIPSCAPLGD